MFYQIHIIKVHTLTFLKVILFEPVIALFISIKKSTVKYRMHYYQNQ